MSQYFDNNELLGSKEKDIHYEIMSRVFTLKTDNGVFSKNKIDEGTYAFLKVLIPLQLGEKILEIGCGYGALGLTLASFHPTASFVLADVNTRALALCRANYINLKLANQVTILQSDCYEKIEGKYSSIVINPPIRAGKKVIYKMYEGSVEHLEEGGSLYIVIRKDLGAKSSQDYISKLFGNVTLLKKDKGYYIYQAINENHQK